MDTVLETDEIRYLGDVYTLSIKPGDVIVIKCLRRITAEQAVRVVEMVNEIVPDVKVMVLPPDLDIGALVHESDNEASD